MAVKLVDSLLVILVGALGALLLAAQGRPEWAAATLVVALVGALVA